MRCPPPQLRRHRLPALLLCGAWIVPACHQDSSDLGVSSGSPGISISTPTSDAEYTTSGLELMLGGSLDRSDTAVGWNSANDYHVYATIEWSNLTTGIRGSGSVRAVIECMWFLGYH